MVTGALPSYREFTPSLIIDGSQRSPDGGDDAVAQPDTLAPLKAVRMLPYQEGGMLYGKGSSILPVRRLDIPA